MLENAAGFGALLEQIARTLLGRQGDSQRLTCVVDEPLADDAVRGDVRHNEHVTRRHPLPAVHPVAEFSRLAPFRTDPVLFERPQRQGPIVRGPLNLSVSHSVKDALPFHGTAKGRARHLRVGCRPQQSIGRVTDSVLLEPAFSAVDMQRQGGNDSGDERHRGEHSGQGESGVSVDAADANPRTAFHLGELAGVLDWRQPLAPRQSNPA